MDTVKTQNFLAHLAAVDEPARDRINAQIAWLEGLDQAGFDAKARPKHQRRHRVAILGHTSPAGSMHYLRCDDTFRVLFGRRGNDLTLLGLVTRARHAQRNQ